MVFLSQTLARATPCCLWEISKPFKDWSFIPRRRKQKKKKNSLFFLLKLFLWTVEKSWSWGFDFIARKEKIQSALVEKKKKSVLFYLGFRAFADQFESLLVWERERQTDRQILSFSLLQGCHQKEERRNGFCLLMTSYRRARNWCSSSWMGGVNRLRISSMPSLLPRLPSWIIWRRWGTKIFHSSVPTHPSSSIICLSASSSDGFPYSSSSFASSLLVEDCQFCAVFCFSHTKFCHLWFGGGWGDRLRVLLLLQTAPERWRLLKAHGPAVGLPTEDDMGNSEVGHNALGAGRIFKQGWVRRRNSQVQESLNALFIWLIVC